MPQQISDRYAPSARLPRNVPEQADVFPDGALGRTARASIVRSNDGLAGRARPGKASSFSDPLHSR